MESKRLQSLKHESAQDTTVQRGLSQIYRNKDGSLPEISHLDVLHRSKWKVGLAVTAAIVIMLGGIAWLGFLLFGPNSNANDSSIELTIDGPDEIASGDEVTYEITYRNVDQVALEGVELLFRYPEGFVFTSADPVPTNNFNSSWLVGSVGRGQSGKITIHGRVIGEVGSAKVLNVTASYQPENFSSVFKETTSFSSAVTSSILAIEIEGPQQVLPEKKFSYTISYANTSDQALENIKIQVTYPEHYIFQEATPPAFHREEDARNLNNQWVIDRLERRQEGQITISGGYAPDSNLDKAVLKAEIGFVNDEGEFSLQQQQAFETSVVQPKLNLSMIVNGATTDQPTNFEQQLTYSVIYKNLGAEPLDDVVISVSIDSEVVDWGTLEDSSDGKVVDGVVTWSKDEIAGLDLLKPLDEGSIDFTIQLKSSANIPTAVENFTTVSQASATIAKIGELVVEGVRVESNQVANQINTDVQLTVEGRYFDDDNIAVGTGPLPPVVGERTTFRMYWSITNSLHPIKDVRVTAELPPGIQWADKYQGSTGKLDFSSTSRTVTWSLDQLGANQNGEEITVWFDLAVIPTKDQVRKLLILTDQTRLSAKDSATDSVVVKTGKAITSNLEDDPIGAGRGLVIDISE